jgi:hypothetical protein
MRKRVRKFERARARVSKDEDGRGAFVSRSRCLASRLDAPQHAGG